ncbi:MAG: cell division protein FtsW [Clostridiales bacterium]|nr:cell division protein FtsW [Clostridiales bacterium]MBD8980188.1 cell division protein FtsW [Clostridiales bacterium]
MPDKLTPPVHYRRDDDDFQKPAKRKRTRADKKRISRAQRTGSAQSEATVLRPKKSFGKLNNKDIFTRGGMDIPLFALTIIILAIGLVMLFSASYPYSYFKYDNSYKFFLKQLIFAVVGIAAMLFVSKINYKIFQATAKYWLGLTLFLLVLVLFYHTNVATDEGEAFKRYIQIPGLFQFQPSDVAKFTLTIVLASYISTYHKWMSTMKYGILYPAAIVAIYCILIFAENHMSGAIIVGVIGLTVMFAGGSNKKIFAIGLALVVAAVLVVILFPQILPNYVQRKLIAFTDKDYDPLGARWQTNNSLYAIGSGGLFGSGLGNSKQKYLYVSQPQNDFIFSIVCEELGFVGALVIILLFAALVIRGFYIATKIKDSFASLTVIGIMTQLGVQVALNILVITDSIPNTGISLPFFSYGGTALVMQLFEIGVVLAVSRKANLRKADTEYV